MNKEFEDTPLSESNVSLKLADIQKRCSELLKDPDDFGGLTLEEPISGWKSNNPYDHS
jgi:hypothetical protein